MWKARHQTNKRNTIANFHRYTDSVCDKTCGKLNIQHIARAVLCAHFHFPFSRFGLSAIGQATTRQQLQQIANDSKMDRDREKRTSERENNAAVNGRKKTKSER